MSFPWYEPAIPAETRRTFARKREQMWLEDVRRRAQILKSLGYDRDYAKGRMRANVRWEFEPQAPPAFAKGFEAVIDEVYRTK